jgi:cephalosporin-C deacetylase
MGVSLGGGVGALELPWAGRIARGQFKVPRFGHRPLRLTLSPQGSAAAPSDPAVARPGPIAVITP